MGFVPDDLTTVERTSMGIEGNIGILLDGVYENSPAEAAGLVRGDVILAINGDPIFTQRQARLMVAGTSPGDAVDVVGLHQSDQFEVTIIVGERPPEL
jgi:S1-C subfamily serine protease